MLFATLQKVFYNGSQKIYMKKIGILTIESLNYGNRLQNYALQHMLESMDFVCETICRKVPLPLKESIKRTVKWILNKFLPTRTKAYRSFDRNIHKSHDWASANEVSSGLASRYDYFISGSDQVWNPYFEFVGDSDLLYFAKSELKIAYAASFGIDLEAIPEQRKARIAELLSDFKALSVREAEGVRIIRNLTGRDAQLVIDPTLTMDGQEWEKLEKRPSFVKTGERYVLVYALAPKSKRFQNAVEQVLESGVRVIDIYPESNKLKKFLMPVGPSEFIYLVHHAEMILSDSFHATAFSLIYHKKAQIFKREDLDMSSRITTIAHTLGLADRLQADGTFVLDEIVDFGLVDKKLAQEKSKAFKFLRAALDIQITAI